MPKHRDRRARVSSKYYFDGCPDAAVRQFRPAAKRSPGEGHRRRQAACAWRRHAPAQPSLPVPLSGRSRPLA